MATIPVRYVTHEALAYMRRYGLDPGRIGADNVGPDGYDEFSLTIDGRLRWDSNGIPRHVRRQWPPGFDYGYYYSLLSEVPVGLTALG